MKDGVTINRPPRDGYMAFIRSPDNISIEFLQKGKPLPSRSPGPRCRTPASGRRNGPNRAPLGGSNPCFQVENPLGPFTDVRGSSRIPCFPGSCVRCCFPHLPPYIGQDWTRTLWLSNPIKFVQRGSTWQSAFGMRTWKTGPLGQN